MKELTLMSAMLLLSSALVVHHQPAAQNQYVPKVELCADGSKVLCPKLPAYIVKDPPLEVAGDGYSGLFGDFPTQPSNDVQTPFDNMAWQIFVALNWAANAVNQPQAQGLTAPGNPVVSCNPQLQPQWIWATFEHMDNAPMAQAPCNVRNGCGTNSSTNWINKPSCGPTADFSFLPSLAKPATARSLFETPK